YYLFVLVFPSDIDWSAGSSPPLSPPRWGGSQKASPQRGDANAGRGEKPWPTLNLSLERRRRTPPLSVLRAVAAGGKTSNLWRATTSLGYLILAGLIGLGLAGVQLLPTAELVLNSPRSAGAETTFALTYSMWPWRWLTLLIPNLFGSPATGDFEGYATYWEDATYLGLLPLLFAAGAIAAWARARWRREATSHRPLGLVPFFTLLALLGSWLAMGQNTPLYPWVFQHLPGFGFFQAPARLLLWTGLALATLAGVGADRFRLTYPAQYSLRLAVAGGIAALATGLALGQSSLIPRLRPNLVWTVLEFALWLILSAAVLLLRGRDADAPDPRLSRSPLSVGAWRWLALIVAAADLLRFGQPLTPAIDPSLYRAPVQSARFIRGQEVEARLYADEDYDYRLKFGRFFSFQDFGDNRPARWQRLRESLLPNFPAAAGLRGANNYDPLEVGRWRAWLDAVEATPWPERARLLRLANVGYLLGQGPPGVDALYRDTTAIYRLADPLPEAYVVGGARPAADGAQALALLSAPDFDPTREAILEGGPLAPADGSLQPARSVEYGANRLVVRTDAPFAGYLVVSQTYYPGWEATIDGAPADILPANAAFQAVPLPAGEHTVVLSYRPLSFRIGAALSLATLVGLALAALFQRGKAILL
ncbi:MAG: YfhO family protein, partial [Anaerolineae bacterium]